MLELPGVLMNLLLTVPALPPMNAQETKETPFRDWAMWPFIKLDKPILSPNSDATFKCPILGKVVRWAEQNVYNPAAVVRDGKVYLLYRADDTPRPQGWGRTCRIGLAYSSDGRNFTRLPAPVLYPDNDLMKKYEWEGGTEDIHVVEDESGTYYVNYTAWTGEMDSMCIATSTDLIHWTKQGPAFKKATGRAFGRSGTIICRREGERLIATKINGKYWMYYTHGCQVATSDNLIDWSPMGYTSLPTRKGYFDSGSAEAGAIALLTERGILLMYNGANATHERGGDPTLDSGRWMGLGQALMDPMNPGRELARLSKPFLKVEYDWERNGPICPACVVANGLVYFKGEWLLYYGAADHHIGLAVHRPGADSAQALKKLEQRGNTGASTPAK